MTEEGAHLMVIGKQRMREEKAGVPMSPRRAQLKTFLLVSPVFEGCILSTECHTGDQAF